MRLPKSWNEITVAQFQECYFILKSDNPDKWIIVISILSGKSIDFVEALPRRILINLIIKLDFLQHPNLNQKKKKYIFAGGRIYKAMYLPSEFNTAQGKAIKTFLSDGPNPTDAAVEHAHKLLASTYLPLTLRGFVHPGSAHAEHANRLKNCKMGDVYGTLFFYSILSEKLTSATLDSIKESAEVLNQELPKIAEWAATQNKSSATHGAGRS